MPEQQEGGAEMATQPRSANTARRDGGNEDSEDEKDENAVRVIRNVGTEDAAGSAPVAPSKVLKPIYLSAVSGHRGNIPGVSDGGATSFPAGLPSPSSSTFLVSPSSSSESSAAPNAPLLQSLSVQDTTPSPLGRMMSLSEVKGSRANNF